MTKITIGGFEFEYIAYNTHWRNIDFPRNIVLPTALPDSILDKLSIGNDTRLILGPNCFIRDRKPPLEWPYIFFWKDGTSLKELDEMVINNTYSDIYFKNCIATVVQNTVCRECKNTFFTLIIDLDFSHKIIPCYSNGRYNEFKIFLCPCCKNPLRQLVIKFI